MSEEKRQFVTNVLVPLIISENRLKSNDNVVFNYLGRCEMDEITLAEAYMLTDCFRLRLFMFSDEEKTHQKVFNLFVKTTPTVQADVYNAMSFDSLFQNEELGYNEVLPFMELTSVYTPKLIASCVTPVSRSLVITDFSVDGWRLSKSRVNLSLEHILLSVELLGKFHGNAYAVKKNDPDAFHQIVGKLKESRFNQETMEETWINSWRSGLKRAATSSKGLVPDQFLNQFLTILDDPYTFLKNMTKPVEPIAILCHGDYLRNNIAFQFKDDIPISAMMFDLQTLRYSSPMIDLCQFMANSTGKDVRPMNFEHIFKTYHNALLESYESKLESISEPLPQFLSSDSLLREYAKYLLTGIVVAAFFLVDLHCPEEKTFFEQSDEELTRKTSTFGGKVVDDELAALVNDLYNFSVRFNLDIAQLIKDHLDQSK